MNSWTAEKASPDPVHGNERYLLMNPSEKISRRREVFLLT